MNGTIDRVLIRLEMGPNFLLTI